MTTDKRKSLIKYGLASNEKFVGEKVLDTVVKEIYSDIKSIEGRYDEMLRAVTKNLQEVSNQADKGVSDAAAAAQLATKAQTSANEAKTAASNAQSTANSAKSIAEAALPKAGGTITGALTVSGKTTLNGGLSGSGEVRGFSKVWNAVWNNATVTVAERLLEDAPMSERSITEAKIRSTVNNITPPTFDDFIDSNSMVSFFVSDKVIFNVERNIDVNYSVDMNNEFGTSIMLEMSADFNQMNYLLSFIEYYNFNAIRVNRRTYNIVKDISMVEYFVSKVGSLGFSYRTPKEKTDRLFLNIRITNVEVQ